LPLRPEGAVRGEQRWQGATKGMKRFEEPTFRGRERTMGVSFFHLADSSCGRISLMNDLLGGQARGLGLATFRGTETDTIGPLPRLPVSGAPEASQRPFKPALLSQHLAQGQILGSRGRPPSFLACLAERQDPAIRKEARAFLPCLCRALVDFGDPPGGAKTAQATLETENCWPRLPAPRPRPQDPSVRARSCP